MHYTYLQLVEQTPRRVQPDYGCSVIRIDASADKEFVSVDLEKDDGSIETVRARYVVGCDGARSTVRECIGLELSGDSANQAWGVMDVLLVTDFPDVRFKSCLLYTSPSPRDATLSRMPSSA